MVNVYEIITERILKKLEQGEIPWKKPWNGRAQHPKNLVSGKEYRGVNVWILAASGYDSPYWISFKQAKDLGGHVKRGEEGTPCVYWNWIEKQAPEGEANGTVQNGKRKRDRIPFLRYYTVFNARQTEGLKFPEASELERLFSPIEACEAIVQAMPSPPRIAHRNDHGGQFEAFYTPGLDSITMPTTDRFKSPEGYYATLFHEMIHSTGHASRLDRPLGNKFGSREYAKEELIAEMGSAYLCGQSGISPKVEDNAAAYIKNWLTALENDKRLVVHAAAGAQKAADLILNKTPAEKSVEAEEPSDAELVRAE